jgi:hypothetical protein
MEQNDSCWLGGPHLVGLLGFVIIIMTTTTIIIIIIIIFLAVIKPKLKANDKSALVQIFFFLLTLEAGFLISSRPCSKFDLIADPNVIKQLLQLKI